MSDEQIIREILSGNSAAFKVLVEKYQQMVFRTAMGFVHSKEDAEDIVQEVFIKVFRALSTFKGEAEFTTWIYRITLNTSLNCVNKNKFRKLFVDAEENLKNIFNHPASDETVLQKMESEEKETIIRKAMDSLPEKQRTAFVLSKYEDLSQREIANIMKTSEGAVEQLLQRAKVNLKKKLAYIVGK